MTRLTAYLFASLVTAVILSTATVFAGDIAPPSVTSNVPTLGEWGMIGTAVALAAAGVYKIFSRK